MAALSLLIIVLAMIRRDALPWGANGTLQKRKTQVRRVYLGQVSTTKETKITKDLLFFSVSFVFFVVKFRRRIAVMVGVMTRRSEAKPRQVTRG